MPSASVLSNTNSHDSGSTASRKGKTRQYRTLSHTSHVDESLFGKPNHVEILEQRLSQRDKKEPEAQVQSSYANMIFTRRNNSKEKPKQKESVQIITKDLIRSLIVPKEDPSLQSVILPCSHFWQMKARSKVQTSKDKTDEHEQFKSQKDKDMILSHERKKMLKQLDITRRKNEKLNDLDEEARRRAEHLLSKAMEQRQEQEDEIKALNELILNAKIQAIRDAQILEKEQIKKEMANEEIRVDNMMEHERRNAIIIQEEIDKRRKAEELIGASKILEQMEYNEQERLLDLERKDQENQEIMRHLAVLTEQEHAKLEQRKLEQERHRVELNEANDEITKRKITLKNQDKLIDAKVLEYQRAKAERDAAFEKEQQCIKIEKEKEVARLRALQERSKDEQAERDALRAKRDMEQAEREWRRKEADEALHKAEMEAILRMARSEQMQQKEHFMAVQAARERIEFDRVLRAQKEIIEKNRAKEEISKEQRSRYAQDVRSQIRDKEVQKIAERNTFFEEGVRMEEEARQRRLRLEEAKNRKLLELRAAGIPEKYLAQVERKVNQSHDHIIA